MRIDDTEDAEAESQLNAQERAVFVQPAPPMQSPFTQQYPPAVEELESVEAVELPEEGEEMLRLELELSSL